MLGGCFVEQAGATWVRAQRVVFPRFRGSKHVGTTLLPCWVGAPACRCCPCGWAAPLLSFAVAECSIHRLRPLRLMNEKPACPIDFFPALCPGSLLTFLPD